jgi:hypothetical protein
MELHPASRSVPGLDIALLRQDERKARPTMSIEERTKRALARGEKLLAEARLAHRLTARS